MHVTDDRPAYWSGRDPRQERERLAPGFARQVALTVAPFLDRPLAECRVLDIGCGFGFTSAELAAVARSVVGLEPSSALAEASELLVRTRQLENLEIRRSGVEQLDEDQAFDLVVMDNVFEHIENQRAALASISRCLRPGGVAFILVPNRLWPIEAHYRLPFLAWLPLPAANFYLRVSGKGHDYRDASYAPTWFGLRRLLRERPELHHEFVLPADVSLAAGGKSPLYRLGVAAIRRWPTLWVVSKSFLVILKRHA